jgi:hypothetical protein
LAVPNINGIYNISYTTPFLNNDTSPGSSTISMGTPGDYSVSRMIHIVYLENPNLKWSNTGNVAPPPVNPTILLGRSPSFDADDICATPVNTLYSWTGNNDWNTFPVGGIPAVVTPVLFNLGTQTFAQSGWYVNEDGYPIRWNPTAGIFNSRGITCGLQPPPNYTPNLTYSLLVDELNGPAPGFGGDLLYLDFNSGSFATATSLTWSDDQLVYPVGDPAPTGWYRDVSSGVRRYWNEGTATFQGASFTQDWVERVRFEFGQFSPGYNNATNSSTTFDIDGNPVVTSICEQPQVKHLTYVAGNENLLVPIISQTQNIRNYQNNLDLYLNPPANGTGLHVTVNWVQPMLNIDGEVMNTPPLINIKDQNRPFANNRYTRVYIDGSDYGEILANGKIGFIGIC